MSNFAAFVDKRGINYFNFFFYSGHCFLQLHRFLSLQVSGGVCLTNLPDFLQTRSCKVGSEVFRRYCKNHYDALCGEVGYFMEGEAEKSSLFDDVRKGFEHANK